MNGQDTNAILAYIAETALIDSSQLWAIGKPTIEVVLDLCGLAMQASGGGSPDCATRAIAFATGQSYQHVAAALTALARRPAERGVTWRVVDNYLRACGWRWASAPGARLRRDELPPGRLVVKCVRKQGAHGGHAVAVIDGVLYDTRDSSWGGTRHIEGWYAPDVGYGNDYQHDADGWAQNTEIPWHYSATEEAYDYNAYDSTIEKAEFVPDMCFGDGRPLDVGHAQAIARTINAFIDRKSAHQSPYLHNNVLGLYDESTAEWFTMFCGPVFMGTEHLSSSVTRSLPIAPFFRSRTGGTAKLRVTILRSQPVAVGVGFLPGEQYRSSVYNDHYSSAEYTTTSTTWQTGADSELTLDTKDIFFGFVWVLVEGQGPIECRGLGKLIEGPREVGSK
jgi:hypothetical protein